MKAREVRDFDDSGLREHIANARQEVFGLRFANATGELENTAGMRAAKRELARALTIARERELDVADITPLAAEIPSPEPETETTSETAETTDD
jgi:large subunit ribosomal protein L29